MRHLLDDSRVEAVYAAAIRGGLGSEQDTLVAGLPAAYLASLPASGRADARMLQTLHTINTVRGLTDGTVPLAVWLQNAIRLTLSLPECEVFREARADLPGAGAGGAADSPTTPQVVRFSGGVQGAGGVSGSVIIVGDNNTVVAIPGAGSPSPGSGSHKA